MKQDRRVIYRHREQRRSKNYKDVQGECLPLQPGGHPAGEQGKAASVRAVTRVQGCGASGQQH